ncbi:MAG: DUF2188 domain-containing protein [Oscillospiraceae bacterium]|jgi:hypothetical protein|nr:DUF2188 domain-containing protein [Oscillospiraceae bacterium]
MVKSNIRVSNIQVSKEGNGWSVNVGNRRENKVKTETKTDAVRIGNVISRRTGKKLIIQE